MSIWTNNNNSVPPAAPAAAAAFDEMHVVKRDGVVEVVAFDKILRRLRVLGNEANLKINYTTLAMKVIDQLYDHIPTTKIDELSAEQCASLASTHPDYNTLAGRIVVSNHHRNTSPCFSGVVERLYLQRDHANRPCPMVSDDLYRTVVAHADRLNDVCDYGRDYLIDYFGFKTLERAYLMKVRKPNGVTETVERPQHMWLRVALGIHGTDVDAAIETYHAMSQKYFTHATPTLFNSGTPRPQLSSCFLLSMEDDSIEGIYNTLKDCALISKWAGGIGLHIHNIRAQGSHIRGTNGSSNGIVPMLRVFNNTAKYVDQCVVGSTLILTTEGYVPIEELRVGDVVANRFVDEPSDFAQSEFLQANDTHGPPVLDDNIAVHSITSRMQALSLNNGRIKRILCHDYEGFLVSVFTSSIYMKPLQITPEHPVFAIRKDEVGLLPPRAQWIAAKDLAPGDHLLFGASPTSYREVVRIEIDPDFRGRVYDLEVEGHANYLTPLGLLHNGGGKRNGSFAIYLEPWHADVEMFLQMRKNHGDEELKARDLFYALWIPDLFMQRVKEDKPWTLMCPDECPGLADCYGDAFVELYERYEREGRGKKTLSARALWFQVLDAQMETGTPYLCYKDAANKKSNQQNVGTIKSSNLCVAPETLVLTDRGNLPIAPLVGEAVRVWNGREWSEVDVQQTGTDQPLVTVEVDVYSLVDHKPRRKSVRCTPYHKFYVEPNNTEVRAADLQPGMQLMPLLHTPVGSNALEYNRAVVHAVTDYGDRADTYCFNEPRQHRGVFNGLLTGQCTEVMEVSSDEETAVCNLASIGLPMFVQDSDTVTSTANRFDFAHLHAITKMVTRNLNKVIDINCYPTEKTRRSNLRHRPIGIGVQGLADTFIQMGFPFYSDEAKQLNRDIFETIYHAAVEQSVELAQRDGPYGSFAGSPAAQDILQFDMWNVVPASGRYDWDALKARIREHGMRNSLLLAPMPTASTSQILGFNECIEPITSNIYSRRTLAGEFIMANKYLMQDLLQLGLWNEKIKNNIIANNGSVQHIELIPQAIRDKYKTVWEIPMRHLIDMAADRGAYICQSQSLNLWLEDPNYSTLTSMHFYGWSKGLKTGIYYLRRRARHQAQQFTIEPEKRATTTEPEEDHDICEFCSA